MRDREKKRTTACEWYQRNREEQCVKARARIAEILADPIRAKEYREKDRANVKRWKQENPDKYRDQRRRHESTGPRVEKDRARKRRLRQMKNIAYHMIKKIEKENGTCLLPN